MLFALTIPVQLSIVFKLLSSPSGFYILNDVVLEELFQQLHSLLPSDLGSKIVIISQEFVQPVHRCPCGETVPVNPEVLSMFPQGHARTEELGHFIPLENNCTVSGFYV